MADYITKIKTKDGDKQIDYNSLANKPQSDTTLSQNGKFADAKAVGDSLAKKLDSPTSAGTTGQVLTKTPTGQQWQTPAASTENVEQIETNKGNITTLQGKVNTLESEMDTAQTDITELESNVGTLTSKMSTAESDIDNLQSAQSTMNTTLQGKLDATGVDNKIKEVAPFVDASFDTSEEDTNKLVLSKYGGGTKEVLIPKDKYIQSASLGENNVLTLTFTDKSTVTVDLSDLITPIDDTLTQEGQAADAKAVGEKIKGSAISDEYSGASEYICEPTVNAPVVVKELDGKTEQVETTGAQLFDAENATWYTNISSAEFEKTDTGIKFTVTKSSENSGVYGLLASFDSSKTYQVSMDITVNNKNFSYIELGISDDSGNTLNVNSSEITANTPYHINLPISNAIGSGSSFFVIYINNTGYSAGTVLTAENIMVSESQDELPWEPYTGGSPAPSPDYPQVIKGVGGKAGGSDFSTEVETQGRNLAEVTQTNKNQVANGVTFKLNDDGSYTLNGTCTGATVFLLNQPNGSDIPNYPVIFKFKEGTKYRITRSQILIRNPTHPNGTVLNAMGKDVFYTPTEDTDVVGIRAIIGQGTTYSSTKTYYPGIWEDPDETRTEWQPFKRTSLSIPLTSPLYEGDKICYVKPGESYVNAEGETVVADGILYGCYRENAVVVFDGSEDEAWNKQPGDLNQNDRFVISSISSAISDGDSTKQKSNMLVPQIWATEDNGFYVSSTNSLCVRISGITEVDALKTWLQSNPLTVLYKLAQPYFEPFVGQSIFYGLRTDDTLSYVYSNDPIEPNVTVEVAKNSTGGILLESYTALAQLIGETVIIE